MSSQFALRFTRYNPKTCERRQSSRVHVHADSFHHAASLANAVLTGLRSDALCEYDIAEIAHVGLGGVTCDSPGPSMFETAEEWEARTAS